MKSTSSFGALRALLACGAVALQAACVGAGGGAPAGGAGTGTGGNVAADSAGAADTGAGGADTATGGADTTGGGGDGAATGDGGATGGDTAVAPADGQSGDSASKPDVTLVDGTAGDATTPLDGKTDSTSTSDVNFDANGTNDCCTTSDKPGCKDPAIVQCVCAADKFCCNNKWDSLCVKKVNDAKCGKCNIVTPDAGPTDSKDVDFSEVSGSQDCCTQSSKPGCKDKTVQSCVCALDSYCCTTAWDDLCVEGVTKEKCGSCGSSSDAGTTDNVGSDTKPDAGATDVTATTADK